MKYILPLLLLCSLLLACSGGRRHAAEVLARAAGMVEPQPDSALLLLGAIAHPERLQKPLRMGYTLLSVQAKDKANLDIAGDTAIFAAAAFFERKNDKEKAALALFYAGRVRQEQQRDEEAARCYLHAIDYAKLLDDKTLQGMACYNLGSLSYDKMHTNNAIEYYKQAYQCFCRKPDDYRRQVMTLSSIGASFSVNKQQDSAMHYLEKGLALAAQHGDSALQSSIYQSIGVAFREKGAAKKAHTYFLQAAHLGADAADEATLYRNLADSYLSLGRRDSAKYYMQLILQSNIQDTTAIGRATTHELLSGIEEQQGSYKKALEHYKQYAHFLNEDFEGILSSSLQEEKHKHRIEKEQDEQRIKSLAMGLIFIIVLTGMALACRFLYWLSRRRKKKLQEAQATIEETLKNELAEQLDMLNKLHSIELHLSEEERTQSKKVLSMVHKIVLGKQMELNWERLYKAINLLFNKLESKLRRLPLDEDEVKICCLSFLEVDNEQQAFIMKLSKGYIQNKKTNIRKKFGVKEYGDLKEALNSIVA